MKRTDESLLSKVKTTEKSWRQESTQCGLERAWNLVPKKYEALVRDKEIRALISSK